MGVAFAFSMFLETQATQQFVSTAQARYLAEAGVNHAWALIDEDRLGSRVDDASEAWTKTPAGSDVDVDGDGTLDARWWLVTDAERRTIGRYAVKVTDEAAKAHLNAVQANPSTLGAGAINLTKLLAEAGISDAQAVAETIEQYRYGPDGRPGIAQVDDDGDGAVDEEDEYQPLSLRGDDRRLESLEDLVAIAGLDAKQLSRISQLATVYSWDVNVSVTGKARVNVNTATADELLAVLLEAGVDDPWQAAVNMADYVDPDVEMSRVSKSSQTLLLSNVGPLGSWTWVEGAVAHYESTEPGGQPLSWSAPVPTGSFRVLARGVSGSTVGDMTVAGVFKPSVESGEFLGTFTFEAGKPPTVTVTHQAGAGTACAFRGLELVPEVVSAGTIVRGVEAIRINELMVDPKIDFEIASATFDPQGSDWACPAGSKSCFNSGVGQARWSWASSLVQPGRYYVRVFGTGIGQTVGEVRIDGNSKKLVHGQTHPSPITVGSDGKITLTIGKTSSDGTYYVERISLSRQPDGEYVELINLSDREIDVSGWTLGGDAAGGRQARLPQGSLIKAHGLLVAAVDLEDEQAGLSGNGIDARSAWEIAGGTNAVQLEFPSGPPSPDDDWLKVTVPAGASARLTLRRGEAVVDDVEYPLPLPTTAGFQSIEKGDPSAIVDKDSDGLDEGWYPSLKLYTPGLPNDNEGLRETKGLVTIVHDPLKELSVLNHPLGGIGELAGLSSGEPWKPFSSEDLAKIVDRLTVEGLRLEAEGHLTAGQDAWAEKADGYYVHTDPSQRETSGVWSWTDLPDGHYRLGLYGWPGERLSVRWQLKDQTFTEWSPDLSTDAQGRIAIGQLTIGLDGTPANTLTLEAKCASISGICHLDRVRLDPRLIRVGPVNINTAPLGVLRALPGMTETLASRLIAGRPYGDQEQRARGIGDLLMGEVLGTTEEDKLKIFRQLAHLLTTRSDMFQILSFGQAMDGDRVRASQRIQTVVQR